MGTETVAVRVLVSGRVTGVGFRYATVDEAERYPGLRGYVRNADFRTVECVLQGSPEDTSAMVDWLRHGPATARVLSCTVTPIAVDAALPPFRVRH
jgi:acylphosphatase